jgi:hypothetical protein
MQALAWWIRDQRHCNRETVAKEFDVVTLETCLDNLELETKVEANDEVILSKFKDSFTSYVQWEVELFSYLSGLKGKSGVPLVYVICKDEMVRADQEFLSMADELIAEVPLTGAVFQEDARQVYHILKAACLGTNGWEWIKEFDRMENGRIVHQALQNHYSGPSFTEARISMAKKIIDGVHYKHKQVFPFESFVTKLNGVYQTLEECGCSKSEAEKVDDLIEKVCSVWRQADICLALMNIRMDPVARHNFTIACNKLLKVVNIMFKSLFVQGKKGHFMASVNEANKHFQSGGGGQVRGFLSRLGAVSEHVAENAYADYYGESTEYSPPKKDAAKRPTLEKQESFSK